MQITKLRRSCSALLLRTYFNCFLQLAACKSYWGGCINVALRCTLLSTIPDITSKHTHIASRQDIHLHIPSEQMHHPRALTHPFLLLGLLMFVHHCR